MCLTIYMRDSDEFYYERANTSRYSSFLHGENKGLASKVHRVSINMG